MDPQTHSGLCLRPNGPNRHVRLPSTFAPWGKLHGKPGDQKVPREVRILTEKLVLELEDIMVPGLVIQWHKSP